MAFHQVSSFSILQLGDGLLNILSGWRLADDSEICFSWGMAYLISSLVGFLQLTVRSASAGSMSGGFRGAGLFGSSSKCYVNLLICWSRLLSVPLLVLDKCFPSAKFSKDPFGCVVELFDVSSVCCLLTISC